MARYSGRILSQATQLQGVPSGTTVNGYMGYLGAAAACGYRLRELLAGTVSTGVPISQQLAVAVYRQTVAPVGTGIAASVAGVAYESWVPADPTAGLFAITATAIGTTGPTIGAAPIAVLPFNSQSFEPEPFEIPDDLMVGVGTANGLAFVLVGGSTLPAGVQVSLTAKWEV
jgi:hypothetical protein